MMFNVLYMAIFKPLKVFNTKNIKGRFTASITTVLLTVIAGTVLAPILYYVANKSRYTIELNIGDMFLGVLVSVATWLVVCVMFWILSKAFRKRLDFMQVASIWGLSYIPTFLCVVLYNILLIAPRMTNLSGFVAFLISALFIMILVWKTILYFVFMRFVVDTTLREMIIYSIVSVVLFTALMLIGSKVGIAVPML